MTEQVRDQQQEPAATVTKPAPAPAPSAVEEPLVVDELLVEDVSIDGMCGVY